MISESEKPVNSLSEGADLLHAKSSLKNINTFLSLRHFWSVLRSLDGIVERRKVLEGHKNKTIIRMRRPGLDSGPLSR